MMLHPDDEIHVILAKVLEDVEAIRNQLGDLQLRVHALERLVDEGGGTPVKARVGAAPTPSVTATPAPKPLVTATPAPKPLVTATPAPKPSVTATPAPKPFVTATPSPARGQQVGATGRHRRQPSGGGGAAGGR